MKYVTFKGNFEEIKNKLEKDGINVKEAGTVKRFQAFTCDSCYAAVNTSLKGFFAEQLEIPITTEKEFVESFKKENCFIAHQVHVVALEG